MPCFWKPTGKPLSDSHVADETTISIVRVTFSQSLIDGPQVQVDSVIQVDRLVQRNLQVDSVIQVDRLVQRNLQVDSVIQVDSTT